MSTFNYYIGTKMNRSIEQLPFSEKGNVYYTISDPQTAETSSLNLQLKTNKTSLIVLVDNHQSYDRERTLKLKESYQSKNYSVISFIVLDKPPSEAYIEDYGHHGPRNLVKLVNYLFVKIQGGENIFFDINQQSESLNLIIAALACKIFAYKAEEALRWCKENISTEFALTDNHSSILEAMDFSAVKVELPEPFPIPTLKGNIYRGVLPRDVLFDEGAYIQLMKNASIQRVITFCEAPELEVGSCTDLISLYKEHGFEVVHFPIPDYGTPDLEKLKEFIGTMEEMIPDEKKTMVHCWSGNGRTGLVLGCYAAKTLHISGLEAISMIRSYIPAALETEKQQEMVLKFE